MASSSVSVYVNDEKIRTYGGTRSSVRTCALTYNHMSVEEFNEKHPRYTISDRSQLIIRLKFNKN